MITYYLSGAYYARLQIGQGMDRKIFYGMGSDRGTAISIAIAKYEKSK